jgi:signal transduction histidine kinase
LLQQARKYGKSMHEGWRLRKDGSRFWASIVITALHNSEGEVTGFSKVTRDLTERKNAEDLLRMNSAQLDLKNKTLERLNEELSSFTHVASHDMKEPLRKIQTYVNRIEGTNFDPEKSREFLGKIKTSAAAMQNLIDDLLSYSQVSNDTTTAFQKTDLNKVVQTVLGDLEVAIHEKHATIDCERLPVVRGVPYQLSQLFLNLLSNAVKFSKPGEPPHVIIRSELIKGPDIPGQNADGSNKYHHISVSDNGIGFSHQQSDKIFEPFQRLHPRTTFSGTGIGLAIVKKVIENHNGIISAEGNPGVGAVFHLYLPV